MNGPFIWLLAAEWDIHLVRRAPASSFRFRRSGIRFARRRVEVIAKALEPAGRILIIEDILPGKVDGAVPLIEIEIDLTMLVGHNGQERTLAEYEELLVREGFRLESVTETGSGKLNAASALTEK